jgi:hypothetical protein
VKVWPAPVRTLAQYVISLVPSKAAIISTGALLPPALRNGLILRLLSAVAARCNDLPPTLTTNLGIRRQLHVEISSSKLTLLFGKPSLFIGDRSSLDLALALFRHTSCFIDVGSANRTVSQTATHVPFVSACTIRASWEHPCDRDHQLMMERSD